MSVSTRFINIKQHGIPRSDPNTLQYSSIATPLTIIPPIIGIPRARPLIILWHPRLATRSGRRLTPIPINLIVIIMIPRSIISIPIFLFPVSLSIQSIPILILTSMPPLRVPRKFMLQPSLLSPSSSSSSFKKQHQPITSSSSFSNPSSPLCPLPENQELSIPIPSSPSFRDILAPPDSSAEDDAVVDLTWLLPSKPHNLHRSRTAPAISAVLDALSPSSSPSRPRRASIVRSSIILLSLYLILGVSIYSFFTPHFSGKETHPIVDALYFCIVTMCTIGYGDITPNTPFAKLFSITFVLFGFGFIDILLSSMVSYVLDRQESLLLASIRNKNYNKNGNYLVDVKKGRMRIRMKVGLALAVVLFCIGVGMGVLRFLERLGWLDSFYLSVMSVTTVGYGDRAFKTLPGRLFASVWLLVSTLAVARAFLYLAEARIDKRHRKIAKWVLARDMTVSEFLAADIDNNGFISKSEFVIYKLKEMGKIADKDILQICDQFDKLDTGNCGKITLSDLTEGHHN